MRYMQYSYIQERMSPCKNRTKEHLSPHSYSVCKDMYWSLTCPTLHPFHDHKWRVTNEMYVYVYVSRWLLVNRYCKEGGLQGFCVEYDQKELAGSGAVHKGYPNTCMSMLVSLATITYLCQLDTPLPRFEGLMSSWYIYFAIYTCMIPTSYFGNYYDTCFFQFALQQSFEKILTNLLYIID